MEDSVTFVQFKNLVCDNAGTLGFAITVNGFFLKKLARTPVFTL
jgi:hypothetical protein